VIFAPTDLRVKGKASGSLLGMTSLEKGRNPQVIAAEGDDLWIFFANVHYPIIGG
jgi:hypothetical protein